MVPFKVGAPFYTSESAPESVKILLSKTTLGSGGARYRHLNTPEILEKLDSPLFLYLQRNDKAIANVTFCRRKNNWYIRYFAFDRLFQSTKSSVKKKSGTLKNRLTDVFEQIVEQGNSLYAYIDPSNHRSRFFAENFGFQKVSSITTHVYSRRKAKKKLNLSTLNSGEDLRTYAKHFQEELFFSFQHTDLSKIYCLKENNEIIAGLRVQHANWKIERLPGRFGGILVKLLPYLPVISSFIKPSDYRFVVFDMVFCPDKSKLDGLFETVLYQENARLAFWWTNEETQSYLVNWGIAKRFIGNPKVDIVVKSNKEFSAEKPVFVSGMDLI